MYESQKLLQPCCSEKHEIISLCQKIMSNSGDSDIFLSHSHDHWYAWEKF